MENSAQHERRQRNLIVGVVWKHSFAIESDGGVWAQRGRIHQRLLPMGGNGGDENGTGFSEVCSNYNELSARDILGWGG
ncbi:MAG: hypothetical protein SynsKO_30280 [Synoicihabitans sp.]